MALYLSDKHNLTAVAAPAITDDRNDGYHEGSRWINVLTGIEYVCIDATVGSARWQVNPYAGVDGVAGLRQALGGVIASPTRVALVERFEKRPFLASDVTIFTDSTGGVLTTPNTLADQNDAVTGTDGTTPGEAGLKTDIDARLVTIANNVGKLASKVNNILRANANFEVAGTNMTSALVTHASATGGITLTTAGANNDQAILQARRTNSGDTRWATGFVGDTQPEWATRFRLPSVASMSVKAGLALTNAHNLTTDNDQLALWFSTATGGNFLIAYSIGGTDATINTGVTPAANTDYYVRLKWTDIGVWSVWLNDTRVATVSGIDGSAVLLPHVSIQALTAAAKAVDVHYQAASWINGA